MAELMTTSGLRAAELHVSYSGADRAQFRIRVEPGALTDLVASACVIAQLHLLRHAAPVFGWTISPERINVLLAKAWDYRTPH
jgi:hypothetical protein